MNSILVLLEMVRDQLLLIGLHQIVDFPLHYKKKLLPAFSETADNLDEVFQVAVL